MSIAGKPGSFLGTLVRRVARVSVYGRANLDALDRPGPALIVVNHTTVVDVIVVLGTLHNLGFSCDKPCEGVCTHRRHIRPIGTSDLWNYPVTKQACTGSSIIPVDQHDGRAAYRAGLQALRNGDCVLIYPEGDVKINEDASPREWRPGAAGLARSGNVTVLPIAHHDSRVLGSDGVARAVTTALLSFIRRPRIRLRIGAAVSPEIIAQGTVADAGELLAQRLEQTWQEAVTGVIDTE
jgi:1-acyl-sn-glycerol-3-phosphate acyltransferase